MADKRQQRFIAESSKVLLHVVDVGHGLTVLLQQGSKFFLYDVGYGNELHGAALEKALQELIGSQSVAVVGAVLSNSRPGLECLIRGRVVRETTAIAPANVDPNECLKSAECKEICRLALDDPSTVVEDRELLDGLSLHFHFTRKYPLIRYSVSQKENSGRGGGKDLQLNIGRDTEKLPSSKSNSTVADKSDDAEGAVLLHVKPLLLTDYPSILVTGLSPIAQIGKMDGIDNESLSVFVVPHQDIKECLSLLPEDMKQQLSNPASLANAALHLALYHMRRSLCPCVERLQGKLEVKGKAFLDYYLHHCKPEAELAAMLQSAEAKVSPIFQSDNFQLNWYKKHKQNVFPDLMKAVSDEEGKQQIRIAFLRDSLAWAHFYSHIRAEVYVMSAENLKQEPRPEVLNGIIIANTWRHTKCCVVITDSVPCSLDEVVQRDVRKLAFPDDNSEPIVRVGFLDRRTVPFFTVNPWSQVQRHESRYHTVSVDTSRHSVSGLGDEPQLHLIRDELDIKEGISTTNSNAVIGHMAHSHRPQLSTANLSDWRRLETYLNLIGYKITYESYGLKDVLDCLLGPSLVCQLKDIDSKSIPEEMMGIIPCLLKQKTSGKSKFALSPTKCSASEAEVGVYIPAKMPLQIGDKTVKSATFIVKEARTMSVDITLKVNINCSDASFKVSMYLDPRGSCGKTIADHIYGICCKEDAWFSARDLTVGEVLHIFLQEERALAAIQSLPLFLSFPLSRCRINHYLTSVLVNSSQTLKEAHICANPFKLSSVIINKHKFSIKIKSLTMHIFPLCDVDQHMIRIEGDCTVNSIPVKFTCSSTQDPQKYVKLFFANTLPATDVFELFGISIPPDSLATPISGGKLLNKIAYEGGFVLSQLMASTEEVSFTSLFFGAEFCGDIENLLPPSLCHIQHAEVKTVVHFPSAMTPKLGIEASFISKLEVSGSEGVMMECCLFVRPSLEDNSYACDLTVRQHSNQYESQDCRGMPVYAIISALSGTVGKSVQDEVRNIPNLGEQLLDSVSLRKIVLQVLNREIQVFELHATVSELDIIHGKLSVNDCMLKISYSKKAGLELECGGNLVFLRHYKYLVHFSLPTVDKKGEMGFRSCNDDLVFKDVMQEFGWLSSDVQSNPVLAEVLDVAVRKVSLDFHFAPGDGKLQIIASEISLFKEKLDIGLVTLHGIGLDISTNLVKGTAFSLQAYISDALCAQLRYNPDSNILSGTIGVTFSKSASAVDVLEIFKPSSSSYDNMKGILQEEFMDVFNSDLKIVAQPGLTASLSVSIGLPSKHSRHYSLQHLNLQVEDALKICCKDSSYVLNTLQFEYLKQRESDMASTSHLSLAVHKLNSKENMTLDFDFTSKQDNTSFFTAKVHAGPQGGFLKLSSAIDLARAAVPELPKFDSGLPHILDVELVSGSVTFALKPSFQPSAFDINILINEWRVFTDPKLTVHKVMLKTTWKSGSCPQLTFTDCSLTFLEHKLNLSGKLSADEVYIECSSAEKLPETNPTHFESILEDYTPNSEPRPVLPTNIELPPMEVELRELIIQLQKAKKRFRLNTRVLARSQWTIKFGTHIIPVHELGGALEWEKLENKTLYKAFLYGRMELFGRQVEMEMLLGKGIDSIVAARTSRCLHYGQAADHLLYSEAITPYDQYNPRDSGLSELVPYTMQDVYLTSASTALNVTKKQFFLSSEVHGWGTGSLLVGYLVKKGEMDYVVSLSLDKGLQFGRLSESLAFVDQLLQLRSVNVLVSSTCLQDLSELTSKFSHSFSGSQVHKHKPFYESISPRMAEHGIRAGTTIYAEMDVARSIGGINKLLELGDDSLNGDISIMTYIGKSNTIQDLEIHAWLPRILLFEMLEFSDIHLMYRVQTASEFELSGMVALRLDVNNTKPLLKFKGELLVNPAFAKFSTTKICTDRVPQPCGIHIKVDNLKLALKMYLNGGSPDVFVSGRLEIGCIALTCTFLLKGITFKVFAIHLEQGLTISALFACSAVDWPVELDLGIKEGRFYYAASNITFEEDGTISLYEDGYHLEAVITLLNSDFRIKADIPSDRSDLVLSGRSIEPVDFFFAKITGARPYNHEGPELKYIGKEKSLMLTVGVEILKHPCFEGSLKYKFCDKSLEGTIKYPGQFLWINEPSMTVRWSKEDGFNIVDFSLFGDVPGFSFLGAIAKFAKVIYNLVSGFLRWSVKLHLKTDKNPNPSKHLVKLVLYGEFVITVVGFDIPVLPLPEVPILLPRVDDFSFAKLPKYILKCLWDSAGPICLSLLKWINPWNLLKKSAQLIWGGIKGAVSTVVNVAKKIGQGVVNAGRTVVKGAKKVWRGICSIFGRSAFILDLDNGLVLGYIRGGKGGQELYDEKYTVEQFGPILTANAIGAMAHDVHRHFKTCVDAQYDEGSEAQDEVDGEERERNRVGLDELKKKAEELAENLTIEADKVLAVKEVCVKADGCRRNISVEWFVYNPEEDTFYDEDKGDIAYHVKIIAIVLESEEVKQIPLYDDTFLNKVMKEESRHQENEEKVAAEACQSPAPTSEEAQDHTLKIVEVSNDQNTTETIEANQSHSVGMSQNEEMIGASSSHQSTACTETNLSSTAETAESNKVLEEKDNLVEVEEQQLEDSQEVEDSEMHDREDGAQSRDRKETPKCISLQVPFDPLTLGLEHTLCICVSIQPTVALEVKMLPPHKLVSEEHRIDRQRLEEGDTLWMDDAKREIEENGRVNEVTLQGKRVCKQQLVRPDSDTHLQFTAQCLHQVDSLTISGDIVPISKADRYLVQLVDGADLTVVIKQCQLLPTELHYAIEALLSDFPETSSGPYHIAAIALCADLSSCSTFTDSELKIARYYPPINLTETLPNLDSSDSDIVRLEWKHPKPSEVKGISEDMAEASGSQEISRGMPIESEGQGDDDTSILDPREEDRVSEPGVLEEGIVSAHFYTVTITGISVQRPTETTKHEAVSIDNIDSSEEAFKIVSVPVRMEQESHEESVGYGFSLGSILKENKHNLEGGLLFQCQVVTNGVSRLHSMPKSFADFILLAPPMDLKVTTPARRAGLHIGWEYSAHAIGYRVELVDENTAEKAFSKVLKRETGSHGESVLCKSDFKDILHTSSSSKGYQLRMYSLGFGQELIRCLDPSVADGIYRVIRAELQYFHDSEIVRVKFRPFTSIRVEYVVALYCVTGDEIDEPFCLTARRIYDHEVCDETVRDFPLKKWWHLLQSGDLVTAWICSTATQDCGVTYIGAAQEEVCVMDSPDFEVSPNYDSDGTIGSMKLAWSEVAKAQRYRFGFFLSDKNEYVTILETQEREAIVDFEGSSFEQLVCEQFQLYITAVGKPGAYVAGELSMDTNRYQCIKSHSLEQRSSIIFTAISLQRMWGKHLADHAFSHYHVPLGLSPQHILFPSGKPFPSLNIPHRFMEKFWETEFPLFGTDYLYARDILEWKNKKSSKPQNEWVRVDPFAKPFSKYTKGFGFSELRLLLYTRCSRESVPGKKMPGRIDIEIKIETKAEKTASNKKGPAGTGAATAATATTATEEPAREKQHEVDPSKTDPVIIEGVIDTTAEDQSENVCDNEDQAETDNESELQAHESDPEAHDPETDESKSETHRAHGEDQPQIRNDKEEPASKEEGENPLQVHDSAVGGRLLDMAKRTAGRVTSTAGKATRAIKTGFQARFQAAASYLGRDRKHLMYKKSVSINLPHGVGPKTYCRWISYEPTNWKLSPEAVITLTIKPSAHCYHEDTHLFVRFAGYNYVQPQTC